MADANEPLAYETIETPATAAAKGFDWIQLGFWSALVIAPTHIVAMRASLRIRSENGVWNIRP